VVVQNASLVVLATPVVVMEQVSTALKGSLASDAVVTDVGSVKGSVVSVLEPLFASAGVPFVGSHPMAGSEQTGIAAARADLFAGATCILTPTSAARNRRPGPRAGLLGSAWLSLALDGCARA